MTSTVSPQEVRSSLSTRREIALIDVRDEALFATGHPLFASNLPVDAVEEEGGERIPRRDVPVVLYSDGDGRAGEAALRFQGAGYSNVRRLEGDLAGWRRAGLELFADVNSYSKAFGELVEERRHTPSIAADDLYALIESRADVALVDARRVDEYRTMSIPTSTSVPGGELVLRAAAFAPRKETTIVVHCAGRTRSILGAQSLINAGVPNPVVALRNGTIGWTLSRRALESGRSRGAPTVDEGAREIGRRRARGVAYRAGVREVCAQEVAEMQSDPGRTVYRFDVRTPEEYAQGHLPGFRSAPGGQLVQEIDFFAPVRGARVVLADSLGARADMTASWLAQMNWEVYVLRHAIEGPLEHSPLASAPPRTPRGRYKRPYEGTDHPEAAMRAYLEWEGGLVQQLGRDRTHGFFVI
jgi:rhodanese-related sulfurtransferase